MQEFPYVKGQLHPNTEQAMENLVDVELGGQGQKNVKVPIKKFRSCGI